MPFEFLGEPLPNPFRLISELICPKADLDLYPWLAQPIRYYILEKELGAGGDSIALLGYPSDDKGGRISDDPVVIKIPNLSVSNRQEKDVAHRNYELQMKAHKEWSHVRNRLVHRKYGDPVCKYANPIFDYGGFWVGGRQYFATVQPFLRDAVPLKDWLVKAHMRPEPEVDQRGTEHDNWTGISGLVKWRTVAAQIARALADIHLRRVIHGDVWPPNIFMRDGPDPHAVFIDFGASFVATPTGDSHVIPKDHAYRAPERESPQYVPTEQVDVYSFGKVLLYLAIGKDVIIERELYGHLRRDRVRKEILERNQSLKNYPWVVDVIARATMLDPAARPRMRDLWEELDPAEHTPSQSDLHDRLKNLADEAASEAASGVGRFQGILRRLVDKKVAEAERLVESCKTEMIPIDGTREDLIDGLKLLFDGLNEGDSWTSLTTPAVWQGKALGLDGRYATATVEAVRRRASVHRTYVVSVEELGIPWATSFCATLEASGVPELTRLAELTRAAVHKCIHEITPGYKGVRDAFVLDHRQRFIDVLKSLSQTVRDWKLADHMVRGDFSTIKNTKGLYLGLVPVAMLSDVRQLRIENPLSLMYLDGDVPEPDKWLLVMTEILGRNDNEQGATAKPHLVGLRIFKSVMGYPKDRVNGLETLMRDRAVNIGPVIDRLADCAEKVPTQQ